jgi:hypothetical protein
MKKRFWYPAILNEKDAHTATLWSCFGYVWIGGGVMLQALLDSAGWTKFGVTPILGIIACVYAAIFGWLTWKQSFRGTLVGFILFGSLMVGAVVLCIMATMLQRPEEGGQPLVRACFC